MKFLLIIPLLVSWNFLFWGIIGIARYVVELSHRNHAVTATLLLSVGVFTLSKPSDSTALTLLNSAVLAGLVIYFLLSVPSEKRGSKLSHVAVVLVAAFSTYCWYYGSHWLGSLTPILQRALAWFLLILPAALLAVNLTSISGKDIDKSQPAHGMLNSKALVLTVLVSYFSFLTWLTFQSGYIDNASLSSAASKSSQTAHGSLTLTAFYFYFAIVFPIYLISIILNGRQLKLYQHLLFIVPASLLLGITSEFQTAAPNASQLSPWNLEYVSVALGIPLLLLIAIANLTSTRTATRSVSNAVNPSTTVFNRSHVAILIPAYNEGSGIRPTILSAIKLVGRKNVFVVNDASKDNTSDIVAQLQVNRINLINNMGKARALETAIRHFRLCENFEFLLILDADSEIDPDYLSHALPLFSDPEVSAVAGHAIPKWDKKTALSYGSFFISYRIKLYMITQAFLRYGQTTRHLNVSFIIPGFSSIYRTKIIPQIDIAAEGLVIEDFNMTFELHRKQLGRIAYSPKAAAYCHEPHSFSDYTSQIKRWHLGFWQTVLRHGLWQSRFIVALLFFMLESLVISSALVILPLLGFLAAVPMITDAALPAIFPNTSPSVFFAGLVLFFGLDYVGTVIVARITGISAMLWHGLFYFALRWLDALYFLITLPMAFFVKSNGRWTSPTRTSSNVT
ncbi:hypothetical protein AB833_18650 [Chromatiales bacterium (ex Bugula neritina AB1)]|nr:hypothetical protein AB833_18650 [Chromatiales bacterium (ex Bugula neritina AB1)]